MPLLEVGLEDLGFGRVIGKHEVGAEPAHTIAEGLRRVTSAANDDVGVRHVRPHRVGEHVSTSDDRASEEHHHVGARLAESSLDRRGGERWQVSHAEEPRDHVHVGGDASQVSVFDVGLPSRHRSTPLRAMRTASSSSSVTDTRPGSSFETVPEGTIVP